MTVSVYFIVEDFLTFGLSCSGLGNLPVVQNDWSVLTNQGGRESIWSDLDLPGCLKVYGPRWHVADKGEAAIGNRRAHLRCADAGLHFILERCVMSARAALVKML